MYVLVSAVQPHTHTHTLHTQADRSTTLAELFVSTYGRAEIPSALSGRVSSLTTPLHPHWGELAPLITRTLLKALYPTLLVLTYFFY